MAELVNRLSRASARGDLPEVRSLLENGASVNGLNKYGRSPLQVVRLSCPDVAEVLLNAGADPDVRDPVLGLTVTHDAARDGYLAMVQVLVDHGADVNLADDRGNLPLHLAAEEGHLEVVRFLMNCTTNPGKPNQEGNTPHDLATNGTAYTAQATATYISDFMGL